MIDSHNTRQLSPASSSASDSDAFNTADARLYFGPLTSPEKKFLPMLARGNIMHPGVSGSPLRRSPRLSTPKPPPSPRGTPQRQEEDVDLSETAPSRVDTPDFERDLRDEPPSALAIRISRAHDNPSPPPTSPSVVAQTDLASPLPHRLALAGLNGSLLTSDGGNESESMKSNLSFITSPPSSGNISPVPSTPSRAESDLGHADLISFDSLPTPTGPLRQMLRIPLSTEHFPPSTNPSVDEILSRSPELPAAFAPQDGQGSGPEARPPMIVIESSETEEREEQEVVEGIQADEDEGLMVSLPSSESERRLDDLAASSLQYRLSDSGTGTQMLAWPAANEGNGSPDAQVGADQYEKEQENSAPASLPEDGRVRGSQTAWAQAQDVQIAFHSPHTSHVDTETSSPTSTGHPAPATPPPGLPHLSFSILESTPLDEEMERSLQPSKFPQHPLPQTPVRPTLPIRFPSPSRSTLHKSDIVRLQPADLEDPSRTPARRVPMAQAISQGYVSPLKESRIPGGSSRLRVDTIPQLTLNIPPTDSPVRRVVNSEIARSTAPKLGTPTRSFARLRVGSAEPPPSKARDIKVPKRAGSTPPPRTTKDSVLGTPVFGPLPTIATPKIGKLPFPIVSRRKEPVTSIPEETGTEFHERSASPARPKQGDPLMSAKATLKQTTSRIPRTTKPYGRPTPKSRLNGATGPVTDNVPHSNPETAKTARIIRRAGPSDTLLRSQLEDVKSQDSASTTHSVLPSAPSLKRKRGVPEMSPSKPRPVVVLRQVPRVVEATVPSTSKVPTQFPALALQEKPLQKIRLVVDKPPKSPPVQPSEPDQSLLSVRGDNPEEAALTEPKPDVAEIQSTVDDKESDQAETGLADATPSPSGPQGDTITPQSGTGREGVRRTTRARKPVHGAQNATETSDSRPSASRRKSTAQASQRQEPNFLGMSATALRALTNSNTAKNQRYLAATLETEIIRKEGQRPESPGVKIRTISQRNQDEKSVQRSERAAKRAKRNTDGMQDQAEARGSSDDELDDESDLDDQNSSPPAKRHRRGPGDEEDYQTPLRRLKRLKLGEEDEVDLGADERRVKWDRGLSTTIYLDEVKLGARQAPREHLTTKGCLAPTAKSVLLDSLGNLPHAGSPLTNLVKESVVVKRFVYDDDCEIEPPVVVKNTRLRNKKGKS